MCCPIDLATCIERKHYGGRQFVPGVAVRQAAQVTAFLSSLCSLLGIGDLGFDNVDGVPYT